MPREVRPRFEVRYAEPADALLERVSVRLRSAGSPLCGFVAEDRISLYVPPARQKLWSPELRIDVLREANVTVLQGMYAPHPHVWVTYVVVLASVLVGLMSALTFGFVQWSMGEAPLALYALLPLLAVGGVAYSLAFVGQGFASEEMDELRAFLDEALEAGAALPSHVRNLRPERANVSQAG